MVIEKKIDHSDKIDNGDWAPKARRQGERANWAETAEAAAENDESIGAPLSPPLWPRVFPGI